MFKRRNVSVFSTQAEELQVIEIGENSRATMNLELIFVYAQVF